jgi:hypothetical protein
MPTNIGKFNISKWKIVPGIEFVRMAGVLKKYGAI